MGRNALVTYRKSRGLTQEQAAKELGLSSKGYFCALERFEAPWPLRLALQVEAWSEGQVPADQLVDDEDRQLLARHRLISSQRPACAGGETSSVGVNQPVPGGAPGRRSPPRATSAGMRGPA